MCCAAIARCQRRRSSWTGMPSSGHWATLRSTWYLEANGGKHVLLEQRQVHTVKMPEDGPVSASACHRLCQSPSLLWHQQEHEGLWCCPWHAAGGPFMILGGQCVGHTASELRHRRLCFSTMGFLLQHSIGICSNTNVAVSCELKTADCTCVLPSSHHHPSWIWQRQQRLMPESGTELYMHSICDCLEWVGDQLALGWQGLAELQPAISEQACNV